MSPIATIICPGRGDTDLVLTHFARAMLARGVRVRGVVQMNTERDGRACDMDVQVLPDGKPIRISQSLGRASRGCRLDPAALEQAVAEVAASLRQGADLLIINKFGKHEAEGRGFRGIIAEAAAQGIPMVVGLNRLNQDAFHDFAGAMSEPCAPDQAALERWAEAALGGRIALAS